MGVKCFIVLCIDCDCCFFDVDVVVFVHVGLLVGSFAGLLFCLIVWLIG